MKVPGKREKRTRLIQTDRYVVAVEVEVVFPTDAPDQPSIESETVNFLREVRKRAEAGDEAWLKQHGKLYAAVQST
jgi:hypothetical protein